MGLTEKEAAERLKIQGENTLGESRRTGPMRIFLGQFRDVMVMILLGATVVSVLLGEISDAVTIILIVLLNAILGFVQEYRTENTLEALRSMTSPTAKCWRDGKLKEIDASQLVTGDVIELEAGDRIPADCAVLKAAGFFSDEALLTGESVAVGKSAGDESDTDNSLNKSNIVYCGASATKGTCRARVIATGMATQMGRISEMLRDIDKEPTPLQKRLGELGKVVAIICLVVCIAVFGAGVLRGENVFDMLMTGITIAIAAIPEGLPATVTIALALAVSRMLKQKALVNKLHSVETLGCTSVICSDKTGTITEETMTVKDFIAFYEEQENPVKTSALLGSYLSAMPDNNATMLALRDRFQSDNALNSEFVEPFSSKTKFSSLKTGEKEYRLGAPEILLKGSQLKKVEPMLNEYARAGLRVLAFVVIDNGRTHLLALVTLENTIRPDAEEAFSRFREQGVRILVISGDNPVTVSGLAQRVGIEGSEKYVSAVELKDDDALREALKTKTVFGRTTPDQKRSIVRLLKEQGYRVAMTGDGVNDILAMKEADCSIAMGTGSKAAMHAAQVVLLDSEFSRMKDIVAEGRRDINNIERSSTLFLVKNLFSLFLGIFSVFLLDAYPLKPTQVSLISSFNIGIPAGLLALERDERKPQGRFLEKVLFRALPAAITDFLVIASMAMFGEVFGLTTDDVSVAATYLLAIVGFMILVRISLPMSRYRAGVLAGCIIGLALCAALFSDLFFMNRLSLQCLLLLIVFAITTEPILRYLTMFFGWIERVMERRWEKKAVEAEK